MKKIYPEKLEVGDEIRVVSPSSSIARIGGMKVNFPAKERLEAFGFTVTFGEYLEEDDLVHSSTIESRVKDLHNAFLDKNVKMVLVVIGGFNCNEILPYLDFDLIRNNPKIICGYSDTTALLNAIFVKTGLVTYYGPSYSSFKMNGLQEYQSEMWLRAVQNTSYSLEKSEKWSSDNWFIPLIPREYYATEWKVYQSGKTCGEIIGGEITTFALLQGTEYQPTTKNPVLFLELAEEDTYHDFNRMLSSILQIYPKPKALMIGRFPKPTGMSEELLLFILAKYPILKEIPVMYDLDFGHTQPIFTFEIGAEIEIDTQAGKLKIQEK
ncbi:Muramoyltetrapeptide carboxypeptidase LdcA (peptidoglycan recycling) [Pilibacter termitis]|uniref:Muramoyltetrapeptide carboxypeptidase LdcA (Peptidoglycan recycling) n=1 Tax=Pilibacter termitis TaxID=263852 RepID=A0A1T4LXE7_9ENTE|nr:S66 peptidase family protein [Pilibacter termitis]SJZ59362.1 Muramoyltetrapeptide carboxypeptidase LdcA (peptidoglycan recycling) [Pilibacter termitis]